MIVKNIKHILTFLGIGIGISLNGIGLANDCLSRYKQLIANQVAMNGGQLEHVSNSAADKNDVEVRYLLEAANKIESEEWEFGEHTSIEMEYFYSLILSLENPQMEPDTHSAHEELPVLLSHMELAHILNVGSAKGFLCEGQQQGISFFDPINKIRSDIRAGLLPSKVSYAEEQELLQQNDIQQAPEAEDEGLFNLEDFSHLRQNSFLSLTTLSESSEIEDQDHESVGEPQLCELNPLPDPCEVEPIDLSGEPPLAPSLEERGKSKDQHFSELDKLYR
ncbi:MAG: hypothetical protein AB8G05_13470 [Oligoflexales bacterium]